MGLHSTWLWHHVFLASLHKDYIKEAFNQLLSKLGIDTIHLYHLQRWGHTGLFIIHANDIWNKKLTPQCQLKYDLFYSPLLPSLFVCFTVATMGELVKFVPVCTCYPYAHWSLNEIEKAKSNTLAFLSVQLKFFDVLTLYVLSPPSRWKCRLLHLRYFIQNWRFWRPCKSLV